MHLIKKGSVISISVILFSVCWGATVVAIEEKSEVHFLSWSNNNSTLSDARKPIYEFDGRHYDDERLDDFGAPLMRLLAGSIVHVNLPDEAKIDDPGFYIPLEKTRVFMDWVRNGVRIIYHYKGKVLTRRTLIFRMKWPCMNADCAEVSLDGKNLESGEDASYQLEKMKWHRPIFLTVRIIYEYSQVLNMPNFSLPGELSLMFDQKRVILTYTNEFLDDRDPWNKK